MEELGHTKLLRSKVLLRSEQSADQVAVVEGAVPADWEGPSLHHRDFDEGFYVLEGELTFEVNGQRITAKRGGFAFAPRGSHHALASFGQQDARLLITCTPAGFEPYFDRLARGEAAEPPPSQAIAVGPPIRAQT
jgi:mannose-6-phosphate isomerase-like protein (cupin superfamily)